MSGSTDNSKRRSPALRILIFVVLTVGLATLVRKWALSKSDQEFEARLRAADEARD
ncbi:MAG: hypothetical protein WBA45_17710 [Microthrixaceae bacterium]